MTPITYSLALLFAASASVAIAVLVQSFRRTIHAWGELHRALAACPERQVVRITRVDLVTRPAHRQPLSRPAPPRRQQPALRAAA
jgi:hypothetical protein